MSELLDSIVEADKKMVDEKKGLLVDTCIENCSSCDDVRCMFHEVNYDEGKLVKIIKSKLEQKKEI